SARPPPDHIPAPVPEPPMPSNLPPSDDLLEQAAEARAGGMSWEAVAAKLDRPAETVRKWPAAYPDRWQATARTAERRLVTDAGSESVLVLRNLLRSADDKLRRDAARLLLRLLVEVIKLDARAAGRSASAGPSARAVQL